MADFIDPAELEGQLVRVYRNLNREGPNGEPVYSLRLGRRGIVAGWVTDVTLRDVTFPISASGQRRARLEHRRNVHAFAEGYVTTTAKVDGWRRMARYNVFKFDTFVDLETERPILGAPHVHLGSEGMSYTPEGD